MNDEDLADLLADAGARFKKADEARAAAVRDLRILVGEAAERLQPAEISRLTGIGRDALEAKLRDL